ncbi:MULTISPECIES: hypothetical protein [unclassified Crossiella]|uniref:hypothetical protein n=1 Tax=unclassified Crossiella TaxID=2620835 RepID=UPI001FFF781B|nr:MULTISPECIES: hypothetical protein [unclassified Crossiella]MCK2238980.1 hypothetical protein [Crossiella sp. S99.2]MCK2251451.1 hypothetical protein [Crossiella sp. S99.1]
MTSYSVLPVGPGFTILATWSCQWSDLSTKVTTLNDYDQASLLAAALTQLSENAWDGSAWLDTAPAIEAGISTVIEHLRGTAEVIPLIPLSADPSARHTEQWSFTDTHDLLTTDLPENLTKLRRTQRLTIADELATDAAARAEVLARVRTGLDPESETSRGWQLCEITRAERNGLTGELPEAGAGWIVRGWGPYLVSPTERWAARDRLLRLEQLAAACEARGGSAETDIDPLHAHLVLPGHDDLAGGQVYVVTVHEDVGNPQDTDPSAPMIVLNESSGTDREVLGKLDPGDDDGFAALLGDWTRLVPFRL